MAIVFNIKNLRITKIKPWSIHFTCSGERFLLHGSSDGGESVVTLHKVELSEFGNYKLSSVCSVYAMTDNVVQTYLKDFKRGKTHSQLNISSFIESMIKEGLDVSFVK